MAIRRNIAANFGSQAVTAFVTVAFIPVYVHFLGIEAYGLVGLFTVLQAWLVLVDFGLTPALAREMARFAVGAYNAASIRHLLRSVESAIVVIAGLVIVGFWLSADWLATNWLTADELPIDVVSTSLFLMGIVIGLRLIENVYRSSLNALERQIPAGALNGHPSGGPIDRRDRRSRLAFADCRGVFRLASTSFAGERGRLRDASLRIACAFVRVWGAAVGSGNTRDRAIRWGHVSDRVVRHATQPVRQADSEFDRDPCSLRRVFNRLHRR